MPGDENSPDPNNASLRRAGAVIVAAGQSQRMDGIDKTYMDILGLPLLAYSLAAFEAAPSIESVVLVLHPSSIESGKALVEAHSFRKVRSIQAGGERRQDSVRNGVECLDDQEWAVVHDGARPCVGPDLIEQGIDEAIRWGSAVAAVPVTDTIKVRGCDGQVEATLDRSRLWAAQTPQIFPLRGLRDAFNQVTATVTDEAALMEQAGYPVHLYLGSYSNIKVTTREDAAIVQALLKQRQDVEA